MKFDDHAAKGADPRGGEPSYFSLHTSERIMVTLGIYIQVPFCASKCSYCNFSSRVEPASVFARYCGALEHEIERLPAFYEGRGIDRGLLSLPVNTLYVGGGTPSLLGAERLEQVVKALPRRFEFWCPLEFTLEVTPGTADAVFLTKARCLGVNRLSIGTQTFDDQELRTVGRLHSAVEAEELVRQARDVGFANLSLDLIVGLPLQTETSWRRTLQTAARLKPEHLSVYIFEIDEKSRLGREVVHGGTRYHAAAVPGEEFMAEAYEIARAFLAQEGYTQYEISNFALPGYESRHNRKYWQLAPYVGLGAGAHSFDGAHRWANETAVQTYAEKLGRDDSPIAEFRSLSREEQLEEFFFLGLRQTEGVDLASARHRWGQELIDRWQERIGTLIVGGLLKKTGDNIRLGERAYLVSNEVFQEFVTA